MPSWTDEQKEAIFLKGKNIIVSAGAGSGKTAVLSQRVLEHVKSGIDICDMLILTFTNAAAAEMKDRIRKKLNECDELKLQAEKVDLAYITTFDAYALSIVKKYNYLLNISNDIKIIDNTIITLKKREILENIFNIYYENEDVRFLKLIDDFCLKDDKEVFDGILSISAKLDNCYDKCERLKDVDFYYQESILNGYIKEYMDVLREKIVSINNILDHLSYYVDGSYIQKIKVVLCPLLEANSYDEIKNACLISLPRLPRGCEEEAKEIKKSLGYKIKKLSEYTKYDSTDSMKNEILATRGYTDIICEIILKLDEEVNNFKKDNNVYDFSDIAIMAIKILKNNAFVRNYFKDKYKEILIDEYQDTNDLQDTFISLIENNNVYMVGDIKQSIYRFRNANPMLFKHKYDAYSSGDNGFKIDLNRNFRSRSEVAANINLIFNLVMDDNIGGADYISNHQMIFGNNAYNSVNHENYNMEILNYKSFDDKSFSDKEIEIFTIAKDIKDKIYNHYKIMDKDTSLERDIEYSDIAILLDRSSSFEDYKKIFEYLNIPLTIYRDTAISDSDLLLIFKNLFNIIIKIYDKNYDTSFKYSFMSILRSFLYDMNDGEILKIIVNNKYFETDLFNKCNYIASFFDVLTIRDVYEKIINTFDFYSKFITVGNVENQIIVLDSIGKIVDNTLLLGYGLRDFLDYLNKIANSKLDIKLSLNKNAANSVKIMTIHASKGLEFGICYFAGLSKKFNIDDLKNKFYYSNDYGFVIPYFADGLKSTILKFLLKQKYIKDEVSEKLRLFYVALTRAREKMIFVCNLENNTLSFRNGSCIDNDIRENYLSFNDVLSSVYEILKPYEVMIDVNSIGLTKEYNFSRVASYKEKIPMSLPIHVEEISPEIKYVSSITFSKDEHKLSSALEKNNIDLGLRIHYLLENTDFLNPDYSFMSDFEKRCVSNFISCLDLNFINLYKEYEFLYSFDNNVVHGFVDLLIEYSDRFLIVDYKLKEIDDVAYAKQLNGYKNYIESIGDKPVSVFLYSILNGTLTEI